LCKPPHGITSNEHFVADGDIVETYTCFTVLDANGPKLTYVYFEPLHLRFTLPQLPARSRWRLLAARLTYLIQLAMGR
jgi:hypothetical protein